MLIIIIIFQNVLILSHLIDHRFIANVSQRHLRLPIIFANIYKFLGLQLQHNWTADTICVCRWGNKLYVVLIKL